MSFDNIPSKSEVMGWASHNLADFLKSRRDLSGCDKVVLKCNINGPRFLNMSDNDLQKFPKLHAPLISRICREINKKEEKKSFLSLGRPSANRVPETVEVIQEDQGWGSEEFESDDDYENPDSNDEGGGNVDDYEHAEDGDVASDNDYEPPPSEPTEELHRQICIAKPMNNSEYIDRNSVKSQPPVPPSRPGPGSGPPPPAPGRPSFPRAEPQRPDRHGKPPPPDRSKKPGGNEKGSNAAGGSMSNERSATPPRRNGGMDKFPEPPRMSKPPLPSGVRRSASSVTPSISNQRNALDPRNEFHDDHARSSFTFPHSNHSRNPSPRPHPHRDESQPDSFNKTMSLPSRQPESINSYRGSSRIPPQPARPSEQNIDQDMDPTWYVGQVTRGQAEGNLRQVNMDGTFLVRDSSKGSPAQPYTLMVLYQGKVFNIQIRKVQNGYLLGTGLKACELFSSVSEIIKQHTQMPLLLIDAKNRGHNPDAGHQKQCALTHPAGF